MGRIKRIWSFLNSSGAIWLFLAGESGALALAWTLRRLPLALDPFLYGQLQITSGLLALIIGAAALVRFRGTRDRLPFILACGFVIVGITLVSSSLVSFRIVGFRREPERPDDLGDRPDVPGRVAGGSPGWGAAPSHSTQPWPRDNHGSCHRGLVGVATQHCPRAITGRHRRSSGGELFRVPETCFQRHSFFSPRLDIIAA